MREDSPLPKQRGRQEFVFELKTDEKEEEEKES